MAFTDVAWEFDGYPAPERRTVPSRGRATAGRQQQEEEVDHFIWRADNPLPPFYPGCKSPPFPKPVVTAGSFLTTSQHGTQAPPPSPPTTPKEPEPKAPAPLWPFEIPIDYTNPYIVAELACVQVWRLREDVKARAFWEFTREECNFQRRGNVRQTMTLGEWEGGDEHDWKRWEGGVIGLNGEPCEEMFSAREAEEMRRTHRGRSRNGYFRHVADGYLRPFNVVEQAEVAEQGTTSPASSEDAVTEQERVDGDDCK